MLWAFSTLAEKLYVKPRLIVGLVRVSYVKRVVKNGQNLSKTINLF